VTARTPGGGTPGLGAAANGPSPVQQVQLAELRIVRHMIFFSNFFAVLLCALDKELVHSVFFQPY
jgi:hypothetical protein